jgi:hypothetical protein
MKFRIKKILGVGFFAQVQVTAFFGLLREWYTIGIHGYHLLSEEDTTYPVNSKEAAIGVITQYKKSLEVKKVEYLEVTEI